MRALNPALAFVLELAAFAAFAIWGASSFEGVAAILAAVMAPAAAIALWAVFAAPRSARRLPPAQRLPFQLVVFGLAAAALATSGHPVAALVLGVLAAINTFSLKEHREND